MLQILTEANLGVALTTLADYPDAPPVEETGETFMENAHLKAAAAVAASGLVSIADDGGLCIDALEGRPGVKSHRFLGEETPFAVKMTRILEMMQAVPKRNVPVASSARSSLQHRRGKPTSAWESVRVASEPRCAAHTASATIRFFCSRNSGSTWRN